MTRTSRKSLDDGLPPWRVPDSPPALVEGAHRVTDLEELGYARGPGELSVPYQGTAALHWVRWPCISYRKGAAGCAACGAGIMPLIRQKPCWTTPLCALVATIARRKASGWLPVGGVEGKILSDARYPFELDWGLFETATLQRVRYVEAGLWALITSVRAIGVRGALPTLVAMKLVYDHGYYEALRSVHLLSGRDETPVNRLVVALGREHKLLTQRGAPVRDLRVSAFVGRPLASVLG